MASAECGGGVIEGMLHLLQANDGSANNSWQQGKGWLESASTVQLSMLRAIRLLWHAVPCSQDFFYVCKTHLKDKGFANPVVDEKAQAEKQKKEAMDREIEKIKKEYEERQKQKKAKKKSKDEKDKKKEEDEDDGKAEKERDDKASQTSSWQTQISDFF